MFKAPTPAAQAPPVVTMNSSNPESLIESFKQQQKENIGSDEVAKKKHECSNGSHQAMVECQVCGLFCHADCVSSVSGLKMCGLCKKKRSVSDGAVSEGDCLDEDERRVEAVGTRDGTNEDLKFNLKECHEADSSAGYSKFTNINNDQVF